MIAVDVVETYSAPSKDDLPYEIYHQVCFLSALGKIYSRNLQKHSPAVGGMISARFYLLLLHLSPSESIVIRDFANCRSWKELDNGEMK